MPSRSAARAPRDPTAPEAVLRVGFVAAAFFAAGVPLVCATPWLLPEWPLRVAIGVACIAVFGRAALLAARGRERAAALLVVANLATTPLVLVALSGGPLGPWGVTPLNAVLAAAILCSRATALVTAAAVVGASAVAAGLVSSGALPVVLSTDSGVERWAELAFVVTAVILVAEAAQRLRAAARRARELFELSADAIFVLDARGGICDVNEAGCELTGRTREALVGRSGFELLDESERSSVASDRLGAEPGAVLVRERVIRRADGTRVTVESRGRRLPDGRIQVNARDVTERREAERHLERLGHALDGAREGIVVFDAEERLVYANRAFRALFDRPEQIDGRPSADELVTTERSRASLGALREELRAGRSAVTRFEQIGPDGGASVLDASFAPVPGRAERLGRGAERLGYVGVIRDVTRDLELEARMRQSQKLEALGRMAGGVAHDFNNLLTVVVGLAEGVLRRAPEGSPLADAAREIRATALHGRDLTTQLLAFGRRQPVRPVRVDLAGAVRATAALLGHLLREDIELVLDLEPGLPAVEVDPAQLRQALVNLATNARDAMPRGGLLTLRASRAPDWAGVELAVADTGTGMDEETRGRVFEPFFTTKPPGEGTGLGLAGVHGFVEQSGGSIEVESRPGLGSTFRIRLPAATGAPARAEPPRAAAAGPSAAHVLVVEDQAALRRVLAEMLRDAGHRVVEASDGQHALDLSDRLPPLDLLVSDVVMPGLDGPTVAGRLRARFPGLRVLFISGYADERLEGTREAGIELVPKPFTRGELLGAVERVLRAPAPA